MANKTTNTFSKGYNLTTDPYNQAKESYSFGLNGIKENIINNPEIVTNERGFTTYLDLGYQYILLGQRYLGKKEYVLFIKSLDTATVTFNRILLINDGVVTKTILDRSDLNFNSAHPIISTYRINYKNQRIVYWVDGLNEDRVMNIDIDLSGFTTTSFAITAPAIKPILNTTVLDIGGNLVSGQYFVAISYNLGEDYTTTPLVVSKGISIANENYLNNQSQIVVNPGITRQFAQVDGDVIPNPTKKALQINLSNLDVNFTSYNIIILRQTLDSNIIRVVKNISLSENQYIFSGNEGSIDETITLNDIITESINYYASEAIIQKDNRLLRGNSKLKLSTVNYQSFANSIVVRYKINEQLCYDLDVANGYKYQSGDNNQFIDTVRDAPTRNSISPTYLANTANISLDNKTFMRDEVYSLGIGFELLDGSESDVFHIPARALNSLTTIPGVGEYDRVYTANWDNDVVNGNPRWKERNTAIKPTGTDLLGQLAYWRSSEVYPDGYNFPTDGEKNVDGKSYVRHHKMPSDVLEPIYRTQITGNPNRDRGELTNYKIYKRNLSLDISNIVIPVELRSTIKKIKLYFTPRNESNKSILSKGLIYDTYENNNRYEQTAGFNMENRVDVGKTVFEFISPESTFNFKQSNLSGNKIKVCGLDKGYVQYAGATHPNYPYYHIRRFNNELYNRTTRQQAIINGFCFYNQRAIPKQDVYSRDIDNLIYVDSNYDGTSDVGNLYFQGSQNTSLIKLTDPLAFKPVVITDPISVYYPELLYPTGTTSPCLLYRDLDQKYQVGLNTYTQVTNDLSTRARLNYAYYDSAFYVQITSDKPNLYGSIRGLSYVECNTTINYTGVNTLSTQINGADTFIDTHHFKQSKTILTTRSGANDIPLAINNFGEVNPDTRTQVGNIMAEVFEIGTQSWGSFMCETDINIRMRRDGNSDDEKYFPKSYINISNGLNQFDTAILNKEFYKVETPYNNQFIKQSFVAYNDIATIIANNNQDVRYATRIIYSDKQNLEDKTDNYRVVRVNNYRDLPLDKGGISIFFVNQEKLFALTRDTLFNVFTSNQSLQGLSENTITVGTGEFLGTEPIDQLSIDGGYAGTSSKLSFVESPYGYLYIDRYKGKILLFDGKSDEISIKDISEFFKENFELQALKEVTDTEFDNPLNDYGYVCGYDNDLNRFLITKLDFRTVNGVKENRSFTLSYSPIAKQWLFNHSYLPNNYIIHPNSLLTKRNDTQLKQVNTGDYGKYFDEDIKPFIIETIFNEGPLTTKVFDNITVNLKSETISGISNNKFFDKIILSTEYQCSGEITLDTSNLTKKERDWMINKFNDLTNNTQNTIFTSNWDNIKNYYPIDKVVNPAKLDLNKPWYQRARFRDKFLKVRFIENNLENQKLIVNFVSTSFRTSQR